MVIAPVGLTVWLVWTVIGWVDGVVLPLSQVRISQKIFLKPSLSGDRPAIARHRRVFLPVLSTFIGWLAKGLLGRSLIRTGERFVSRMPIVRSIYSGVKQIAETVFSQADRSFEKACLIEYPRKGIWAVGFISTPARDEVKARGGQEGELLSVFVPTTPNPTSGFLLFFPKEDVIELDMSIEDAAKLVISAGLVYPEDQNGQGERTPPNFIVFKIIFTTGFAT